MGEMVQMNKTIEFTRVFEFEFIIFQSKNVHSYTEVYYFHILFRFCDAKCQNLQECSGAEPVVSRFWANELQRAS